MQLLKKLSEMPYAILLILFLSISIPTFNSSFLSIDDSTLIVNNPQLNLSITNFTTIFLKPLGQISDSIDYSGEFVYYRPALILFYVLNNALWGINPIGFHLFNLLLHLMTTIIVYRTGLLLFSRNREISLLAAALFCAHPVHNELIGRVAMNENLLGLFMAASLFFYLKKCRFLSLFTFVLALLSKESAIMLPFVILFFELRKQKLQSTARYMSPFVAIMILYLLLRTSVIGIPVDSSISSVSYEPVSTMLSALGTYLRLLFFPYPLRIYYPAWEFTSPFQPDLLVSVSMFVLLVYAIWMWKDDELLSPLLLGIVVLLMPVVLRANELILGLDRAFIAERQLYVPSMLFSLFIAAVIMKVYELHCWRYATALVMLVIPFFAYTTIATAAVWKNDDTLYARFFRDYPNISFSRMNKGNILLQQGNLDGALQEFRAILPVAKADASAEPEQLPGSSSAKQFKSLSNFFDRSLTTDSFSGSAPILCGNSHHEENKSLVGLLNQHDFAAYQPKYADIHFKIGLVYLARDDVDAAIKKFRTALVLRPYFVEARTALANGYMKKRMYVDASREFKLAFKDMDVGM